jgi:hypothetical protein
MKRSCSLDLHSGSIISFGLATSHYCKIVFHFQRRKKIGNVFKKLGTASSNNFPEKNNFREFIGKIIDNFS